MDIMAITLVITCSNIVTTFTSHSHCIRYTRAIVPGDWLTCHSRITSVNPSLLERKVLQVKNKMVILLNWKLKHNNWIWGKSWTVIITINSQTILRQQSRERDHLDYASLHTISLHHSYQVLISWWVVQHMLLCYRHLISSSPSHQDTCNNSQPWCPNHY